MAQTSAQASKAPGEESRAEDIPFSEYCLKPIFENIPRELRDRKIWALFKGIPIHNKDGSTRISKPPLQPSGEYAKVNKPETWSFFETVYIAYTKGGWDGVGIFTVPPYLTGDIDHCAENAGPLTPDAWEDLDDLVTYCEYSPSGTGIRFIVKGKKPGPNCKHGNYELYDDVRFVTITGHHIDHYPPTIEENQPGIDAFYARRLENSQEEEKEKNVKTPLEQDPTYLQIIEQAGHAANGDLFSRLFCGNNTDFTSESNADLAFCDILAWYTKDPEMIARIWRSSGRKRPKLNRDDYVYGTIRKALNRVKGQYPWPGLGHGKRREHPQINITDRELPDLTTEALSSLREWNNPLIMFVRAGQLVRLTEDEEGIASIEVLGEAELRGYMARAAKYVRVKNNLLIATIPLKPVVQDILALPKWPGFYPLKGIITCPVIRPDGSVLSDEGYDQTTRLYYSNSTHLEMDIKENATKEDAVEAARYLLEDVLGDFPFLKDGSAANMLAALLTTITLSLISGTRQMGLFDKPQPGTGASLLAEIMAIIATGKDAVMRAVPREEDEWRKQITSVLMNGPQIVILDNVDQTLRSRSLSQVLTLKTWSDRLLGQNKGIVLEQTAAWFATGNNLSLGGDMGRRCYWIRIEANSARPWEGRTFKIPNILEWVKEHRGELLSKLITMVRAWIIAGRPDGDGPILGGYEEWCKVIGGILSYADIKGFQENREALYDILDMENKQWDDFLDQLQRLHRGEPITASTLKAELEDMKADYNGLRDAMPDDIKEAVAGKVKGSVSLAKVLSKHKAQVFPSGRKLTQTYNKHSKHWEYEVITIPRPAEVRKEAKSV